MNVVIFGKGFGKPRQLNLVGPAAWVAAVGLSAVVAAAGVAGGDWFSAQTGSGVSQDKAIELAEHLCY